MFQHKKNSDYQHEEHSSELIRDVLPPCSIALDNTEVSRYYNEERGCYVYPASQSNYEIHPLIPKCEPEENDIDFVQEIVDGTKDTIQHVGQVISMFNEENDERPSSTSSEISSDVLNNSKVYNCTIQANVERKKIKIGTHAKNKKIRRGLITYVYKRRESSDRLSYSHSNEYGEDNPCYNNAKHYAHSSRERKHACDYPGCTATYIKKSHLNSHTRKHTGDRPYVCEWEECGRPFGRNEDLKRHFRTHTGEKPFVCTTCGRGFSRKDHWRKHIKIHNSGCDYAEDQSGQFVML